MGQLGRDPPLPSHHGELCECTIEKEGSRKVYKAGYNGNGLQEVKWTIRISREGLTHLLVLISDPEYPGGSIRDHSHRQYPTARRVLQSPNLMLRGYSICQSPGMTKHHICS